MRDLHFIFARKSETCRLKKAGFTLIELLVVLAILSMMAGVVLPSAAVMMQKNRLEALVHQTSVLCREAFEKAVFSGKNYQVTMNENRQLVVDYFENSRWVPSSDMWLRPVTIPQDIQLDWPEKGWQILPEGYCESPQLRFFDQLSNESVFVTIRAYDAHFVRKTAAAR